MDLTNPDNVNREVDHPLPSNEGLTITMGSHDPGETGPTDSASPGGPTISDLRETGPSTSGHHEEVGLQPPTFVAGNSQILMEGSGSSISSLDLNGAEYEEETISHLQIEGLASSISTLDLNSTEQEEEIVSGLQTTTEMEGNNQLPLGVLEELTTLPESSEDNGSNAAAAFTGATYSGATSTPGASQSVPAAGLPISQGGAALHTNADDSAYVEHLAAVNSMRKAWGFNRMTDQWRGRVGRFLEILLANEEGHNPTPLAFIFFAHVDQFVEDIVADAATRPGHGPREPLHRMGSALQLKWYKRFKEAYFAIGDNRMEGLKNSALRNIVPKAEGGTASGIWRAAKIIPRNNIKPGTWWLNLACAMRDGIVDNTVGAVTYRDDIVFTVPLIHGSEVQGRVPDTYKYIHEGPIMETHPNMMVSTGHRINIVRGYTLKSIFGPIIGVRYDGQYRLEDYKHTYRGNNVFRVEMSYRWIGTRHPSEAIQLPSSSQNDFWEAYKRVMKREVLLRDGPIGLQLWLEDERRQLNAKYGWWGAQSTIHKFLNYLAARRSENLEKLENLEDDTEKDGNEVMEDLGDDHTGDTEDLGDGHTGDN